MAYIGFIVGLALFFLVSLLSFKIAISFFKLEIPTEIVRVCSLLIGIVAAITGAAVAGNARTAMLITLIGGIVAASYYLMKKVHLEKGIAIKATSTVLVLNFVFLTLIATVYKVGINFI